MKVVTFGEVLLRLSAPGSGRLLQEPALDVFVGGSEANVAASLARFGAEAWHVTRLPHGPLGDAALAALREEGIHTDLVRRGEGRMGLYFTETGAGPRAGAVLYDREASAFRGIDAGSVPWRDVLTGADWLHVSGITPALGAGPAAAVREALEAARAAGAGSSLDLNFRRKLWTEEEAGRVLAPLVPLASLLVANEEHLSAVLGIRASGEGAEGLRELAASLKRATGVSRLLLTVRRDPSASESDWRAVLLEDGGRALHESPRLAGPVVDRIGAGDAFVAGFLYATLSGRGPEDALRFAMAAGALKQTIPGDVNRVSVDEVDRLAGGGSGGLIQR